MFETLRPPILRPPPVRPTIPASQSPDKPRTTWAELLGKPTTLVDAGIVATAADVGPGTFPSGTFSFPGPLEVLNGGVFRMYQAGGAAFVTLQFAAGLLNISWPINVAAGSTFAGTTTFATLLATVLGTFSGAGESLVAGDPANGNTYIAVKSAAGTTCALRLYSGGTLKWYVGRGVSDGSDNFQIYNAAGSISLLIDKTTNLVTVSTLTTTGLITPGGNILWAGYGSEIGVNAGSRILFEGGTGNIVVRTASADTVFKDTAGTEYARLGNGTPGLSISGTKVVGARNTGWTAQTAAASKADLGAAPTVGAIAQWASAIQSALSTHGLLG